MKKRGQPDYTDHSASIADRNVDIRAIAKELGVRYILEGSIRRSGNWPWITGQFIETDTGTHVMAAAGFVMV